MLTSWNMVHYTVATSNIHLCRQLLFAKTLLQLFIVLNLVHLGKKWGYTLIPRLCSRLPSLRLWVQTRFFNPRHLFVAYSLKRLNECQTRFNFKINMKLPKKTLLNFRQKSVSCPVKRKTNMSVIRLKFIQQFLPWPWPGTWNFHGQISSFIYLRQKLWDAAKMKNKHNNWIMGLKSAFNFDPGHDLDFFRAHSH